MIQRTFIGLLIAAGLIGLVLYGTPLVHYVLIFVFAIVAGLECYSLLDRAECQNFPIMGTACGIVYLGLQARWGLSADALLLFFGLIVLAVMIRQVFEGVISRRGFQAAGTLLGFFYVYGLFSIIIKIYQGGTAEKATGGFAAIFAKVASETSAGDVLNQHNILAILFLVVVVKMADTGAYFIGSLVGSNRLAPRLSPKKTWEGVIGGFVVGVAAAWVWFEFFKNADGELVFGGFDPWGLKKTIIAAVGLILFGVLGDLAESALKRAANTKDSSVLPDLGGALDMADSVLLAAPVMFLFLLMGPGGILSLL